MNHPIIKNANQYFLEQKYVSIHSSDINLSKYPNISEFEISLPQELLNVASVRLYSWDFPEIFYIFSEIDNNLIMSFKFINLYNPIDNSFNSVLFQGIYDALYNNLNKEIIINIQPGNYNPQQMATELTNKFNEATTLLIKNFFNNNPLYSEANSLFDTYQRFKITFNEVSQQFWFGNIADTFMLVNDSKIYTDIDLCIRRNQLPENINWGLPYNLGFTHLNAQSYNSSEFLYDTYLSFYNNLKLPRFFYETTNNGFWLIPDPELIGSNVYFLKAPFKFNFNIKKYIYMEILNMNNIDETSPWNISKYTITNTQNNSTINSAFAKIPINISNSSRWYDDGSGPYKYWNPPAERISKLKVKFRYHNGMLVDFGSSEFSFMLEFNILKHQQEKIYSVVNAYDLSQQQNFSKI
jgi:hypothetical protein